MSENTADVRNTNMDTVGRSFRNDYTVQCFLRTVFFCLVTRLIPPVLLYVSVLIPLVAFGEARPGCMNASRPGYSGAVYTEINILVVMYSQSRSTLCITSITHAHLFMMRFQTLVLWVYSSFRFFYCYNFLKVRWMTLNLMNATYLPMPPDFLDNGEGDIFLPSLLPASTRNSRAASWPNPNGGGL